MKEKLTWFDSSGQEYYFDYPIGTMKEKDVKIIEELNLEQLHALDELLYLEEYHGKNVTEAREKVWDIINSKSPYAGATKEELQNLLLQAQRLEEEGLGMTETIIKVEKALELKVDSGIIYEAE